MLSLKLKCPCLFNLAESMIFFPATSICSKYTFVPAVASLIAPVISTLDFFPQEIARRMNNPESNKFFIVDWNDINNPFVHVWRSKVILFSVI